MLTSKIMSLSFRTSHSPPPLPHQPTSPPSTQPSPFLPFTLAARGPLRARRPKQTVPLARFSAATGKATVIALCGCLNNVWNKVSSGVFTRALWQAIYLTRQGTRFADEAVPARLNSIRKDAGALYSPVNVVTDHEVL